MKPLEKLPAIVDATTPGPFHVGHIDENLEHAEIENNDGIPIAEVYGLANQNFFCSAGNVMPALIEVARQANRLKRYFSLEAMAEMDGALAALDKAIERGG